MLGLGLRKGPISTAKCRTRVAWLEHAITQLPLVQREVLLLVVIEGHPLDEAAAITDAPLATVKTRLRRARQSLAKALSEREQTSAAGEEAVNGDL